ncbi:uncharacterized protein LOC111246829 isoform X2 [Varroa destructor]|nr:uncharacterized protein LOC111246829 isoform X2 [Varroa destructor]XP_022652812.1 uncharacterized protein LOC111246829 isoform X2 [Varroa destructor]
MLRGPSKIPSRHEMPPPTPASAREGLANREVPRIMPLPSRRPPPPQPQPSRPPPPPVVQSHEPQQQHRFIVEAQRQQQQQQQQHQQQQENKNLHLLAAADVDQMATVSAVPIMPPAPTGRTILVTRSPKMQHVMSSSPQILPTCPPRVQEKFVSFDDSVRSYSPDSCATSSPSETPRSTPDSNSLTRSLSHGARSYPDDSFSSLQSSDSDKAKASRRLWSFSLPRFKKNSSKSLTDSPAVPGADLDDRGQTLPRVQSTVEATDERTLPGILKKSASLTSINELDQGRVPKLSKSSASQNDLQHAMVTSPQNYRDPQTNEEYQRQIVFHTEFEKHYVMPPRALRKYIKTNFRRLNLHPATPKNSDVVGNSQTVIVETVVTAASETDPKPDMKTPVERDYESGISSGSSATDNESHSSFGNSENTASPKSASPEVADPADAPQVVAIKYKPPQPAGPSEPPTVPAEPLPAPRNRDRYPEPEYINGIQYIKEPHPVVQECCASVSGGSCSGEAEKRRQRRRSCGSVSSSKSGRTGRRKIPDPRIARRTGVKKYLSQTNHYIVPTKESKGKYRKGVPQGIDLRRQSADRGTIEPNDQQSPMILPSNHVITDEKKSASSCQLNTSSSSSNFSSNGSGFLHQQLLQLLAENNHLKQINDKLEDQLDEYRRRDEKRDQQLRKNAKLPIEDQLQQIRNLLGKLRRLLRSEECHLMIDTVEHYVVNNTCKNSCESNGAMPAVKLDPLRIQPGRTATTASPAHIHRASVVIEQKTVQQKIHIVEQKGNCRISGERRQK